MLDMGGSHGSQALEHAGDIAYCDPRTLVCPSCGTPVRKFNDDRTDCGVCDNLDFHPIPQSAYAAQLLRDNN